MRVIQNIKRVVSDSWQSVGIRIGLAASVGLLLLWKLSSLIPVALDEEKSLYGQSTSVSSLLNNPLHIIMKASIFMLRYFNVDSLQTVRYIAVSAGILTILLFFYIVKQWFRSPVVIMSLVLVTTSSWFLTMGRLATPDIFYALLITAGFAYGAWTRTTKHSGIVMAVGISLVLLYAYTPGLIWLALIAIAWQGRTTVKHITDAPKTTVTALTGVVVCLSPLAYAIYKTPLLGFDMLGLSQKPLEAFKLSTERLEEVYRTLVFGGPASAQNGLVGVAHLDVFMLACVFLGCATVLSWRRLDRQWSFFGAFVTLMLLIVLQGVVPIAALWPIVMLAAAAGISLLYERWFRVFPKNPVAKSVALSLFAVIVGLTTYYHLQKYYIAWPQSVETLQVIKTGSSQLR